MPVFLVESEQLGPFNLSVRFLFVLLFFTLDDAVALIYAGMLLVLTLNPFFGDNGSLGPSSCVSEAIFGTGNLSTFFSSGFSTGLSSGS